MIRTLENSMQQKANEISVSSGTNIPVGNEV